MKFLLTACVIFMLIATSVSAMSFPDAGIRQLEAIGDRAELVMVGTVVAIEYAQSVPSASAPRGAPHTFVTYRVEQTLSGEADGSEVTLRFLGGPLSNGRISYVDGFPLFDVGDRDLLLIAGNGHALCPLLTCSGGRFRLHDGRVYSEEGRAIELTREGLRAKGPQVLPAAISNRVGEHTLSRVEVLTQGEQPHPPSPQLAAGTSITEADLLTALNRALGLEHQRQSVSPFRSVDASKPVTLEGLAPTAPPKELAAAAPAMSRSDEDLRELAALRANGWNPVLPSRSPPAQK